MKKINVYNRTLQNYSTEELTKELMKREGVSFTIVNMEEKLDIKVEGPCIVFNVID